MSTADDRLHKCMTIAYTQPASLIYGEESKPGGSCSDKLQYKQKRLLVEVRHEPNTLIDYSTYFRTLKLVIKRNASNTEYLKVLTQLLQ